VGVDFLQLRAKPFIKGWDSSRLELAKKNLFTREAEFLAVGAIARIVGPVRLNVGDDVLVRVDCDSLVVVSELTVRAVFLAPPCDVVDAVRQSGGYANGCVASVSPTHDIIEVVIK
jgi:hypothetical protein